MSDTEKQTTENKNIPTLSIRKHPSQKSILQTNDNRPVILFVTVTSSNRQPVFTDPKVVDFILDCWRQADNWLVGQYVFMPDHIHFFCAPGKWPVRDFHKWMKFWKGLVSLNFPVEHKLPLWQSECWDTQMRTMDGYREKWHYVRNNPVRKGLVDRVEDWPYQGVLNILEWHEA